MSAPFRVSRFSLTLAVVLGFLVTMAVGTAFGQEPDPDPTGIGAGALSYGLSEIVKWAVPLLGSLLFSGFNKAQSAIAEWNDALKAGVYIVLTTALMYVGEFLNITVSNNPADWTGTFWEGIAAGLVGTLLVKLGIGQARDPNSATSSVG